MQQFILYIKYQISIKWHSDVNDLPSIKSNNKGSIAKTTDFPYPVGKETKVSLPDTKVAMASTCLGLSSSIPMYCAALLRADITLVSVDVLISFAIYLNLQTHTTSNLGNKSLSISAYV